MRSFEIKQVDLTDTAIISLVSQVQASSDVWDAATTTDVSELEEMHFNENQGDIVLVASVDGVPAGVATDMAAGGALSIWIVAEYRGLGVEDALLHAIETVYRLNGHVKAEAPVNLPEWLNELLQRNRYRYLGSDELVKDLRKEPSLVV